MIETYPTADHSSSTYSVSANCDVAHCMVAYLLLLPTQDVLASSCMSLTVAVVRLQTRSKDIRLHIAVKDNKCQASMSSEEGFDIQTWPARHAAFRQFGGSPTHSQFVYPAVV